MRIRISKEMRQRQKHRTRDREAVLNALERSGLLKPRVADTLAFHITELLEICRQFRPKVERLKRALRMAKGNSKELYRSAMHLISESHHWAYHMPRAARTLSTLTDVARKMPPLREMSESEFGAWFSEATRAEHMGRGRSPAQPKEARRHQTSDSVLRSQKRGSKRGGSKRGRR